MNDDLTLDYHHEPSGFSDRFALALVRFMRFFADAFFAGRYGHRAVVLETVAGTGTSTTVLPTGLMVAHERGLQARTVRSCARHHLPRPLS